MIKPVIGLSLIVAESEGFEPSARLRVQRFSRPSRSTTPATLLYIFQYSSGLLDLSASYLIGL